MSATDRTAWESLWLTNDVGTTHYACGPTTPLLKLAVRFQTAKVAQATVGECCHECEIACAFDVLDDPDDEDHIRKLKLLAESLARAEGREPRPFTDLMLCEALRSTAGPHPETGSEQ